jgi:hypothetical protein
VSIPRQRPALLALRPVERAANTPTSVALDDPAPPSVLRGVFRQRVSTCRHTLLARADGVIE